MSLIRTDTALAECRIYLSSVGSAKPPVDSSAVAAYLASHIVIVLCGEVEASVTSYFDELIDAADCDPAVTKLAKARKGTTRSAKFGDIADALSRLGPEVRGRFEAEVNGSIGEEGIARLGNAVGVRDQTAHEIPPAITFGELELAAQAAKKVLIALRVALALPEEATPPV